MEFQERVISNKEVKDAINYKYEIDGILVEVSCKKFNPSNKEFSPNKAVIFLRGWPMAADASSGKELNQSFADNSGEKVYSITTRAKSIVSDSLFKEAEAIRCFIKDNDLKEVIIAGRSEGGSKAINLTSLIQDKNPEITVKGLILLDVVGLYEQENRELVKNFLKDTLTTLPDNLKDQGKIRLNKGELLSKTVIGKSLLNRTRNTVDAGVDIMSGVTKEIKLSRFNYPKRLSNQIQEMVRKNPRIEELKVPIILISGTKDLISSREKIFPKSEEDRAVQECLKYIDSDLSKTNPTLRIREKYLKDKFFPQSPYVRMIIPEDFGHHGLPLFRPKSIAKASLYLLRRYTRENSL